MMLFTSFSHGEVDGQLMERSVFKNGEKAFEELYCRHAPRFKGSFMRMLSVGGALADDFPQELFLRVCEARGSYQHGKQFSTWAFAMAYNFCKGEYRHRNIVDEYRLQQSYINEEDSYSLLELEMTHGRQVFDRQLKKVPAGLTDEQQAVYTLRYEGKLPVQEIVQILCCPEGTVEPRLRYILKVLQRSLLDYNPQKQMSMKSDDLERPEGSQEMQQLIHVAKEQYEQEKSVHPLAVYAAFAQNLRERQKDGKMKAKQEPPERETFGVKGGKRSGISPWWLVAACLLGGVVGYGVSATSDRQEAGLEKLAVADTVIVIREWADTVYREVEVSSQSLVASWSTVKPKSTGLTEEYVEQSRKAVQKTEPASISIEFL